ncbi:MAG: hemolysin activation protein, partial [Clostridia bacterium]|nr:hemolysin activation protein [Clostridia bacterium]
MSKKPYLVDVPVRINIWIRPECQKRQFEVLKEARPSTMFLISDGGRNEKEWEAIRQSRAIFEEIDWECTVYKIFEEKNNGLYTMSRRGADLIWSKVDRCIFLEDDNLPSVSFFAYAAELLEKYKDDERIVCICSMNHAGVWEDTDSDYFFAERGPIWGQAIWKRSYMQRDFGLEY